MVFGFKNDTVFAARHHYLIDHHLLWGVHPTVLADSQEVLQLAQVEGLIRELSVFDQQQMPHDQLCGPFKKDTVTAVRKKTHRKIDQ